MNFTGRNERQWNFDDAVRFIKIIGGPPKEEGLLVGLKNGNIYKIFLNNPFPIMLIQQEVPIKCLDMSPNKRKLAVVDDNNNLSVYDLITKELLFTEMNVSSVAWNNELDELLAYSGKGYLYIKTGDLPANS